MIHELLPPNGRRGQPGQDHRRVTDGIPWALSDGGRWRNVPARYGNWKTGCERFRGWSQEGVWDDILSEPQTRKAVAGAIHWDLFAIDGSVVRAHPSAAGASTETAPDGEPADHAPGRSQGGFGTKRHLVAAVGGGEVLPLAVEVGPGQQHETRRVVSLVEALDERGMLPERLAGDKGYSAKWIRAYLLAKGVEPVIPHQKSEPGRDGPFDRAAYRERNLIERGINLVKWFRRVATRDEKLAVHYRGVLTLAILFRVYLA